MALFATLSLQRAVFGTFGMASATAIAMLAVGVSAASAADKVPMTGAQLKELLGKGLAVTSLDMQGGKNFTGTATFASAGTLSGNLTFTGKAPIPLTGSWRVDGDRICRVVKPLQPQEVCETWLRSGDKEVVIRVGTTEVGMIRWQ